MKNELSLILPTLNEYKNLKFLIPQIVNMLLKNKFKNYEILVVDDGSTDNTEQLIREFNQHNPKIKFITRESKPSLPLSIWSGVEQSNFENVMWLDADGSMHVLAIEKLINIYFEKNEPVIGSRFVDGGGYKGVKDLDNQSFLKAIINVGKSEDSVLGMVASMVFNKFLNLIFKSEIKDLTSGFIILQKKMLNKKMFETAEYGEYFLEVVTGLMKSNFPILEIGYICDTRKYGKSKTASSFFQLISRGVPYIKTAYKCRKNIKNANT